MIIKSFNMLSGIESLDELQLYGELNRITLMFIAYFFALQKKSHPFRQRQKSLLSVKLSHVSFE